MKIRVIAQIALSVRDVCDARKAAAMKLRRQGVVALISTAALALAACAASPRPAAGYVSRLESLALLQTLNADLLSHDSATLTLERWCGEHHMADPARVVAQRVRDADKPLADDVRVRLDIAANEPVRYRHVQLRCGTHVLSEADNWYVPGRLTDAMNRELDTTDTPFGKVVAALKFRRRTLAAELLWQPLPAGWEMDARAAGATTPADMPHDVLRHTAVLYSDGQVAFSAVVETYTSELLAFRADVR